MTLRARSTSRRSDRSRQTGRRTLLTNLAFGVVIVVAFVILGAAAAASFYGDHYASVSTVNGHQISKDDLRDRYAVDGWRLNEITSRVRDEMNAGRVTPEIGEQQLAQVEQRRANSQQRVGEALSELIDAELQAQLAAQLGVTVSDQQVTARLVEEATIKEQRHAWVIELVPDVTAPATTPTAAQKKAARSAAEVALARLRAGQKWEDVAKASSVGSAGGAGDLGYIQDDASDQDPAFLAGLFAAKVGEYTDVIEGVDGSSRIGRVTDVVPQTVDPGYQDKITDGQISLDVYRRAVRADLLREALSDRIVADATTKPSEQRQVSEIVLTEETDQQSGQPITEDQVKVRHILYAPGGDAAASPAPSTDPAWAQAKAKAEATYEVLKRDPSKFAEIAKRDSADTGSAVDGGDLPFLARSTVDKAFGDAVFKDGLAKDELLPPVASQFGWHVIQFIERKAPADTRMTAIQQQLTQGADFAKVAKEKSDGPEADKGGDIGWVARYQLSKALEDAIFGLPVGTVSAQVKDASNIYLFKVTKVETRVASGEQLTTLKDDAFNNWYAAEKAKAKIETDQGTPAVGGS
jgi:parvulin-like peptidyl-prolyl isomerase